nr:integrase core domain-containing protein [Dyella choica]
MLDTLRSLFCACRRGPNDHACGSPFTPNDASYSCAYPELETVTEHTEQWLADYNQEIPHDSLGGLTPAEFRVQNEPATSDLIWH